MRDGSKIGRKNVGIHFSGSECASTLESRRWFLHSYENSLEIIADVINLRELGLSLHAVAATPPMWPQTEVGLFPFVCLCRIVHPPRSEMAKTKLPKEKLEPLYSRMEEQERERPQILWYTHSQSQEIFCRLRPGVTNHFRNEILHLAIYVSASSLTISSSLIRLEQEHN